GNARAIRLKKTWTEPSVIWAGIVADSGSVKSPAQKAVLAPVYRLQRELLDAHAEEMKTFNGVKEAHALAVKRAGKEGKPPDNILPDPPTAGRVITGDITIEK